MDTFIQFVGLCVLTAQIAGGNATERMTSSIEAPARDSVVVVMPRVKNSTMPTSMALNQSSASRRGARPGRATSPSSVQTRLTNVEDHTAMLVFNESDSVSVEGWGEPRKLSDGFQYIELNGEHLSITSDAPNGKVAPTLAELGLGKLGGTLTDPFRPPAYSGSGGHVHNLRGNA
jgi:hypothetical protein